MTNIMPFLWYKDGNAEAAASFYTGIFPDGAIKGTSHWGEGAPVPAGTVLAVEIFINGQSLVLFNGGPHFTFTEAISLAVYCDTQDEIDRYWDALQADGGSEVQCGWLKDKYGLSWQVVPRNIAELVHSKGAMMAMMQMKKLDIAALQAAATS